MWVTGLVGGPWRVGPGLSRWSRTRSDTGPQEDQDGTETGGESRSRDRKDPYSETDREYKQRRTMIRDHRYE